MLERQITDKILNYLKTVNNSYFWKQVGGLRGVAGLPDIICCVKGLFVAFEVKQPGKKLTKLQEITIKQINDAGGAAFRVESLEDVKDVIKLLEAMPK